ncbi:MAG: 5'-nucleotidase C-terminal domain-containing protein [Anaerolineae bacterium]|nr:5'-nucleotidase C-terminal domain-containing protein [Anaerolineae bacterium]
MSVTLLSAHAQDDAFTLTVMHTNDVHATYDPDRDDRGGAARQAAVVKTIRAEVDHSLLVDSGDRFTGSMFHSFYQGWDSAQVMNQLGYDAMVLGSYEFTHGAELLANFLELLEFPVVVANADFGASDLLEGKTSAYTTFTFDGEIVGVIGVTQGDSRIRPIPNIEFDTDYVGVIQREVDALTAQGVNKIILLSHLGYFTDLDIATQLAGVDLIVGGDSNTLLSNTLPDAEGPYPAVMHNLTGEPILVVQAWQQGRVLGRLDMVFDANGVLTEWDGDAILLNSEIEDDPDMVALIEELRAPLPDFLDQVIGTTEVLLDGDQDTDKCRYEECNIGNLITDAMRDVTGAQIAFQNGGGIRASIEPGEITVGDVLAVVPFNNTFVIFEISGDDMIAALENSVSRVEATEGTGRFLQVSGLRFTWDGSQPVGRRVASVEVLNKNGTYETLDPDEVYTVVTNDYLYAGGDDYTMFANGVDNFDFGRTLDEIVRTYVAKISPINIADSEGRIKRLDR